MSQQLPIRRVLQVHTRYRQPGGEDLVVEAEKELLESAGISVGQVMFDNAEVQEGSSLAGDVRLAASAIWSRRAHRRVADAIGAQNPDVVHVHNTFAAASPSVFAAARGVPLVHTLHNYRMVCPVAITFRDGHACTDCVGRVIQWPGVLHACVRRSRAQSAVAAATAAVHRGVGTYRRIGVYVALTSFQRALMIEGGLAAARIKVIPNFLEPDPGTGTGPRSGVVYVGRLAAEKGVEVLLGAARIRPGNVSIIGDGPLAPAVQQAAAEHHLQFLGRLDRSSSLDLLRAAVALVVPSLWFEGFPLTVVEAYATGTPVIASRIGSLAEVVEDGATGLLADAHDAVGLAERIEWAIGHPDEMRQMGSNARSLYEARFRGATHLADLLDAYQAAGAIRPVRIA